MKKSIRDELDRLRATHGGVLTKELVVTTAADKTNPLHAAFTWDKTAGWKKNLLAEAGALIRCYFIVVESPKPTKVRALISLSTDRARKGGGYRGVHDVLSDAALYQTLLDDALREMQYFEARYRTISELSPVFEATESVRRRTGRGKKRAA